MKFLFVGSGYPGVDRPDAGSGIGTYLREMTLGLSARGHLCHVLVWAPTSSRPVLPPGVPGVNPPQELSGVLVHGLPHSYWPLVERAWPDSADARAVRLAVQGLDSVHGYDWIEIESEEGIASGVQLDFPGRVVLRLHTTLGQMVIHKRVQPSHAVRARLRRERRSIALGPRLLTHSALHAAELRGMYALPALPRVVKHGIDWPVPHRREEGSLPMVLVIGTADLRKGFDRIRPAIEAFSRMQGRCRLVIVADHAETAGPRYALEPGRHGEAEIVWEPGVSPARLQELYGGASLLLHLARYESFGLPYLEAAASGVPIVSTRTGVAPELLRGELEGFLVAGDQPDECARAMAAAAGGRGRVGALLRERYKQGFTRDCMVDAFLSCIAAWPLGVP